MIRRLLRRVRLPHKQNGGEMNGLASFRDFLGNGYDLKRALCSRFSLFRYTARRCAITQRNILNTKHCMVEELCGSPVRGLNPWSDDLTVDCSAFELPGVTSWLDDKSLQVATCPATFPQYSPQWTWIIRNPCVPRVRRWCKSSTVAKDIWVMGA